MGEDSRVGRPTGTQELPLNMVRSEMGGMGGKSLSGILRLQCPFGHFLECEGEKAVEDNCSLGKVQVLVSLKIP